MMKKGLISAVFASACILAGTHDTAAADAVKLKVATFLPATHHIIEHGTQVWMDSVKAAAGDAVDIEFYPAGQAGKATQLLDIMKAGAVDVIGVPLGYYSDRFPLFGIVEMPGVIGDPCRGAAALREVATDGGLLHEGDIAPQGLHPLAFYIFPPYAVISREPITTVADFAGKKIRTSGGAMELEVGQLGGVAVKMSSPEILQSLARGTIDGTMLTYLSAKQYDLHTEAAFATKGYSFGGASIILMMSDTKYQSLSADMKAAVDAAGVEAEQAYCSFALEGNDEAAAAMEADGLTLNEITPEAAAELDEALAVLSRNWASQLDESGKPGTEVLEAFRKVYAEQ